MKRLLLVFLLFIQILYYRYKTFSIRVTKTLCLAAFLYVITDSIVFLKHVHITALRELWGELSTGLRVSKKCIDIFKVELWNGSLEELHPAVLHGLSRTHEYRGLIYCVISVRADLEILI